MNGHEESGLGHANGNTEWPAEYRSLELRQGPAVIISGFLPCMELTWQVAERRRDGFS